MIQPAFIAIIIAAIAFVFFALTWLAVYIRSWRTARVIVKRHIAAASPSNEKVSNGIECIVKKSFKRLSEGLDLYVVAGNSCKAIGILKNDIVAVDPLDENIDFQSHKDKILSTQKIYYKDKKNIVKGDVIVLRFSQGADNSGETETKLRQFSSIEWKNNKLTIISKKFSNGEEETSEHPIDVLAGKVRFVTTPLAETSKSSCEHINSSQKSTDHPNRAAHA